MNLSNPFNLALLFILIVFWTAVILLARRFRSRTPTGLLVLPLFFLILGLSINRYYMPYGTYAIAAVHVMMLPALMRLARARK
jgi:uncharacterized membrane protein YhaH (DUF805 family)